MVAHQRNHNLHVYRGALCADVHGGLDDGACLHLGDFGIGVAQAAAAVSQHRVELGERFDLGDDFLEGNVHLARHLFLALFVMRHELVQGRVEQAYGHGESVHGFEQSLEVAALDGQQFGKRYAASGFVVGEDHLADSLDAVAFEEHVLRAAEADTLGAECERLSGVFRRVGVGAYFQHGVFARQVHQLAEVAAQVGGHRGYLAQVNLTRRAVERNPVALLDGEAVDIDRAGFIVDLQFARARYAAFAHTACNDGGVRGHTAACGQDTGSVEHALEVFGRSFDTYQNRFLAALGEDFLGVLGEEHNRSRSCARRGGQALGDDLCVGDGLLVENGVEQFVEFGGLAAQYGRLFVDQSLAEHVHRDFDHGGAGTLAVAALEHPELAVLNRELDVLHVLEVLLQVVLYLVELLVNHGHHLLERGVFRAAVFFGDVLGCGPALRAFDGDLLRGADAGYDVLALRVDQVLAVEDVFTRRGVARECHARRRIGAHVAEHHGLYRYGRTPFGGDVVEFAVEDGAVVHPRAEHGAYGAPELLPRACGEVLAGLFLDGGLELFDQFFQVFGRQVGVVLHAALLFHLVDNLLERVVVFFRNGFHAQHHVAVHLHETAVRVPCETGIARTLGHGLHGLVVHTQVEDGVHHAGHRGARTRTYRYEQRHLLVAEFHARELLDIFHRLFDFRTEHLDDRFLAVGVKFRTYFRGNREARGNGDADEVHLCEVGTLAAEQFTHFAVAFGFLVTEGVDSFNVCHNFSC